MNELKLKKYLREEVSEQERLEILRWIQADENNQRIFNKLKAEHVAKTLENVDHNDTQAVYDNFVDKHTKRKRLTYGSYAAAIAVLIAFASYWYQYNLNESSDDHQHHSLVVSTQDDFAKKITLPDGSVVLLNINSQLQYPRTFDQGEREVALIGEGHFDVTHDPERPFIVKTRDFDVKVLGTSFNVKSYQNDSQTETTLISGKVEVLREKEIPIVLAPSQKAVYYKTEEKIEVEEVISKDAIAWQQGTLVFKNTPMRQVALDLERKYNIKIVIKSPKLLTYEYTGTFDNLTLEESLQLLMISSPIKYTRTKDQVIIDMK